METSTNLGRVSLVPRGAFDASAVYDRLDVVEHEGSSYLTLADGTIGVAPAGSPAFMLLAQKGETGAPGPQGNDGPEGPQGAPGIDGTSFVVLGRYATVAALEAAHPDGNAGEAWTVGSAEENDIYLWNVDTREWQNIGHIQGPPGPAGTPGKDGRDGKSAYQLAVDGGFEGTEEEWLASLKGADGGQGTAGAPGKSAYQYAVDGGYTGTEEEFSALIAAGSWIPSEGRLLERGSEVFNGNGDGILDDVERIGWYSHVEGCGHSVEAGDCIHIEGNRNWVSHGFEEDFESNPTRFLGLHIEGSGNGVAFYDHSGEGIHVEGMGNHASFPDNNSLSVGIHMEGWNNEIIDASCCHIEGNGNHIENAENAFVGGYGNSLMSDGMGDSMFVFGRFNEVNTKVGHGGVVFGAYNELTCGEFEIISKYVAMIGEGLKASAASLGNSSSGIALVMGQYNNGEQLDGALIVGGGTWDEDRSNCFRVTGTGVYASGSYHSSGADYAELFEWADGNPGGEDRIGRFVTLDGDKMRLAQPGDPFVLGVVSGFPSVVGDAFDDQWQGMYQCDVYGRPIWEEAEIQEGTGTASEAGAAGRTRTVRRRKLNPDYDPEQAYIPRSKRPEWGCVGLMGKLTVIDDGNCQVNGWCAPGAGGIAVHSEERTDFRVIHRIDATHVRVLALGRR